MGRQKKYTNIQVKVAASECFLDAQKYLADAGVKFINSPREHRYGLSIMVDDSLVRPIMLSPFSYAMSRNALAGIYVYFVKNERLGGPRRTQALIKVMNNLIRDGYKNRSMLSHNIETGKYTTPYPEVVKVFGEIFSQAMVYSLGGDTIRHMGDIYSLLGGEVGTYHFLKEVMLATEASLPNLEVNMSGVDIKHIPHIKCYTCRFCKVSEGGARTCSKVVTALAPEEYAKNPRKYRDVHHSDNCRCLVSSVIDSRMDTCDDYVPRVNLK